MKTFSYLWLNKLSKAPSVNSEGAFYQKDIKMQKLKQVINLQKSIEYKDDCIERKEVFSNEQSSVTLFALNQGQSRDLHVDPYDEAIFALEGTAEITISEKAFTLNSGDFIIMPKGEPHGIKAITNFKMALLRPQHKH